MWHKVGLLAKRLPRRRVLQLGVLLLIMLASAVAEVVSLGAILPFLAILIEPQKALGTPLVSSVVAGMGLDPAGNLRLSLALLFALAALASGLVRFVLTYATAKLTYGIGHELAAEIYRRSLYQPYEIQVSRNSSEVLGGLNKVDQIVFVVLTLLSTASSVLIAAFIITALILIDPGVTVTVLLGLGAIYGLVFMVTRLKLIKSSHFIGEALDRRVQAVQEGLGGIRDILLDHTQVYFYRRFKSVDWPMREALANIAIIGPSPRFAVEAVGMALIALLAYKLVESGDGIAVALPALGALVLGMQRLMPLIQQMYIGFVQASGNRAVLQDVINLLEQPIDEAAISSISRLPFEREIRFDQVHFSYKYSQPTVLQDFTLSIPKGARVGFVGVTGSGKSTFMDLLMGLLQPTSGKISIDGEELTGDSRIAWQKNIAHVPQSIFLADASFAENIAFGISPDEIDMHRVRAAAAQAKIAMLIEASPRGYDEVIGERGVRLSGGQRQRIGIARALYKSASVIVFDEATNALDGETEAAVIASIESLGRDITILMIAHRLSTLEGCDTVVEISNGRIQKILNYANHQGTDGPEKSNLDIAR